MCAILRVRFLASDPDPSLDSDNHLRLQVSITSSIFKIVQKLEQCMFKYQAGKIKNHCYHDPQVVCTC